MERSAEVESFVSSMYERMRAGDGAGAAGLVFDGEGVVFVGTDADEWWDSAATTKAAFREQLEQSGGFDITAGEVRAHADGDVGWFADQPMMRMSDGTEVPMRMTGVVVRDGEGWRCVQGHLSVAANLNEVLFD